MITVNKQEHEWRDGMTLQTLLDEKRFYLSPHCREGQWTTGEEIRL